MSRSAAIALSSAAALAVSLILGGALIAASGPTYDEPVHLASGYNGLTRGRFLNWRDHPPLGEMWAALPLPLLSPRVSALNGTGRAWPHLYDYADSFLYQNGPGPEKLLDTARVWCLLSWSALILPAVAAWAYALGGAPAAAVAAGLLAFCPPWFSNAALVTTDAPSAVFFFLAFFFLSRPGRGRREWLLTGAATGLALASKFNMIALPVFLGLAYAAERRLAGGKSKIGAGPWLAAGAALVLLTAAYFGDLPRYAEGVQATLTRLGQGRGAFLAGRHSTQGWLWYFPLALGVKTPLAFLALAGAGIYLWSREPEVPGLWLVGPTAFYFAAACVSKTQIGLRHILPIYPFLAVLGGWGASRLWQTKALRPVLALFPLWLGASVLSASPYYLAYFNELAGGRGWTLLADSNLDWGQGLKALGEELHRRGDPPIVLCYFGSGDPSAYGIHYWPLAWVTNVDRRDGVVAPPKNGPVLFAISATNLNGVYYADHDVFAWLRGRKPAAVPGHSIFLYDLTDDPDGRARLGAMLAAMGAAK